MPEIMLLEVADFSKRSRTDPTFVGSGFVAVVVNLSLLWLNVSDAYFVTSVAYQKWLFENNLSDQTLRFRRYFRFGRRVSVHVTFQYGTRAEGFPAEITLVRLYVGTHVRR